MSVESLDAFWYFDKHQKLRNGSLQDCKVGFAKLISESDPGMIKDNDTNLPSDREQRWYMSKYQYTEHFDEIWNIHLEFE